MYILRKFFSKHKTVHDMSSTNLKKRNYSLPDTSCTSFLYLMLRFLNYEFLKTIRLIINLCDNEEQLFVTSKESLVKYIIQYDIKRMETFFFLRYLSVRKKLG